MIWNGEVLNNGETWFEAADFNKLELMAGIISIGFVFCSRHDKTSIDVSLVLGEIFPEIQPR